MAEKFKADIFAFFRAMNDGNFRYVDDMTDEEVKGLSPYVLLMWLNGAQSNEEAHIILTDMICNRYVFKLAKHPRLLLKLFISANCGIGNTRYKFTKYVDNDNTQVANDVAIYYKIGLHEARDMLKFLTDKELKNIREMVKYMLEERNG